MISYKDIIYRLKELKIITNYIFKQLNNFINNYIGIENYNLIKNEHSFQYKRIVHKLESSGIITINKACELLNISLNDYYKENYNYWY